MGNRRRGRGRYGMAGWQAGRTQDRWPDTGLWAKSNYSEIWRQVDASIDRRQWGTRQGEVQGIDAGRGVKSRRSLRAAPASLLSWTNA